MKKVLILILLISPFIGIGQTKPGIPEKKKAPSSFSAGPNLAYEYATITVITKGEKITTVVEGYDLKTEKEEVLGKYRSIMQALQVMGAQGYQVVAVEEKDMGKDGSLKTYLIMRAVPKSTSGK